MKKLTFCSKISSAAPQQATLQVSSKVDALKDCINKQNQQLRALRTDLLTDRGQFELLSIAKDVLSDADSGQAVSTSDEPTSLPAEDDVPSLMSRLDSFEVPSCSPTLVSAETRDTTQEYRLPSPTDRTQNKAQSPQLGTEDIAESVDDFDKQVLEHTRSLGQEAYQHGDYGKAERHFSDATDLEEKLHINRSRESDVSDSKYELSMCALHTKPLDEAESVLLKYLESPIDSESDALKIYEVGHNLSQVYVRLGKLDLATTLSEQTLRGRHKLLGSDHQQCRESLGLLSRIYELQGNVERADVYTSMITEEQKDSVMELFRDLEVSEPHKHRSMHDLTKPSMPGGERVPEVQRSQWLDSLQLTPIGPIQTALAEGDADEAMRLINSGIPDVTDPPKPTALHIAVLFGNHEVVKELLQRGWGCSAWCEARLEVDTEKVQALHLAIAARHDEVIRVLVEAGARFDQRSSLQNHPAVFLLRPTRLRPVEKSPDEILSTLKTLHSLKFDLNSRLCGRRHTLLHLAFSIPECQSELRREVITFLLDKKADVLRKNRDGFRPIHSCLYMNGSRDDVSLLLGRKPRQQIKAITCHGNTALHIAVSFRDTNKTPASLVLMRVLLDAGSNVRMATFFKMSPLKYMQEKGDREAIELLEEY